MSQIDALLVQAFQKRQIDLHEEALPLLRSALRIEPDDPGIKIEIARTLLHLALRSEAIAVLRELDTPRDSPANDAELTMELARLWTIAGEPERALTLYKGVSPESSQKPQAVLESALLLERSHRLDEAHAALGPRPARSSRRRPDPSYELAAAVLDERNGEAANAEARLRTVWENTPLSGLTLECGYRLARLRDRAGSSSDARQILERCKRAERAQMPGPALDQLVKKRREADLRLASELPDDFYSERTASGSTRAIVLGHPRSGTSLLSRQLCLNSERAVWVDESPAFSVLARHAASGADTLSGFLCGLTQPRIARFERAYIARLTDQPHASTPGHLIDKNPGLSSSLPALHRLLPGSAWIYLERDPRDIAISCYFQRFGATSLGWSCQTLPGALDAVMHTTKLWLDTRDKLRDEQAVIVRYESLVTAPRDESNRVRERLGWSEAPSTRGQQAEPSLVHSPSYAEIRRTIDGRAVERWRRHADAFGDMSTEHRALLDRLGYLPTAATHRPQHRSTSTERDRRS